MMKPDDVQVMIDLETFSQKKQAAIVSIGAVKFNAHEILDKFIINIDPRSCKEVGLIIDKSTLDWWAAPERKEALAQLRVNPASISDALDAFSEWFGPKSYPTWGNGASFDNVILENAYQVLGKKVPWEWWDERCFRTLKNLFDIKVERVGTYHNALDDAITQVEQMQKIMRAAM